MGEERNTELENKDCLGEKLKQMLSEELSDIQVSEELIQRTLQAAQESSRKASSESRAKRRRLRLFQGCAAAAALLVLVLGLRSIHFSLKSDSWEGENSSLHEEGFDSDGKGLEAEGIYKGEPEKNGSFKEDLGNQWPEDGSAQAPQEGAVPYPGEPADGLPSGGSASLEGEADNKSGAGDGCWDSEYAPNAAAPTASIASDPALEAVSERELLISRAVEILLSETDETAGITLLDGFTDTKEEGKGERAYQEFRYAAGDEEEIEITGRVYPDGRLEGKLTEHGQVAYKAVAAQPEMKQLWKILNMQAMDEEME